MYKEIINILLNTQLYVYYTKLLKKNLKLYYEKILKYEK